MSKHDEAKAIVEQIQLAQGEAGYAALYCDPKFIEAQVITEAEQFEGGQKWLGRAKASLEEALRQVEALEKVL